MSDCTPDEGMAETPEVMDEETLKKVLAEKNLTPYAYCLKLERDRDYHRRESEQGAFDAAMMSYDTLNDSFDDPSKIAAFSDHGAGTLAIQNYMNGVGTINYFHRCIKTARMRVERTNKKLLEVFNLVIKNGNNKEESIWEMVENERKRKNGTKRAKGTTTNSKNS